MTLKHTTFRKALAMVAVAGLTAALWDGTASAHVAVKPAQVAPAAFQPFSVGVPTERDSPTVKLRLVVPAGVKHVTPNVKPGWTIDETKDGDGEDAIVKEIVWSGGEIPAGQRDDFSFSLQAPSDATILQWKAYQTYADGTVVSWDQSPKADETDDDSATSGPYSETKVAEEADAASAKTTAKSDDSSSKAALSLAVVSLAISALALTRQSKQAKK